MKLSFTKQGCSAASAVLENASTAALQKAADKHRKELRFILAVCLLMALGGILLSVKGGDGFLLMLICPSLLPLILDAQNKRKKILALLKEREMRP